MTAHHAVVRLRYRPASDVVGGEVELDALADTAVIVESPDADTHLEWRRSRGGEETVLASFQIVHVSSVLDSDTLRRLPPEVASLVRQLVRSGRGALRNGASALEQVQARADTEATLTLGQLRRPATTPTAVPTDSAADTGLALAVTAAVHRLATVLAALPHRDELGRRDQLVHLLRELADVMRADPGTPSPGTSAAARAAVRGGVPLTGGERRRLRAALAALDHPNTWRSGLDGIVSLTDTLAPGVDR